MAPFDARTKIERLRKNKSKNNPGAKRDANVSDLRQLISKKSRVHKNDTRDQNSKIRANKNARTSDFDLRSKANRKIAARNNSQTRDRNLTSNRNDQGSKRQTSLNHRSQIKSIGLPPRSGRNIQHQQYYVPPHLQHQTPTYIITAPAPTSNLAMDNVPESQGASVLISNLIPQITQSEIIELFGDIGVMTAVNMINQTTALVTYQNSSDAVRAVKVYNSRLLDGKPMFVNMMPNSTQTSTSNVRSRIGRPATYDSRLSQI